MKLGAALLAVALLANAGCDRIPADPDHTLERVRADRSFRVGLIASGVPDEQQRARDFLSAVASETGATSAIEFDAAEPLLLRLEQGDLDLVIGELAPDSPWSKRVSLLPALDERSAPLTPVARNGENAWIAVLHRNARAVSVQR